MLKFKKKIQMGYIILQNNSVIWLHKQNHDTPGSQAAAVSVIEEKKNTLIWVKMPFMRFLGVEEIFNREVGWKRSRT